MSLSEQLQSRIGDTVVVVGIGNPLRGDDAAGSCVAQRLTRASARASIIVDAQEVPESYLGRIVAARPDTVILVDAVDIGGRPGDSAIIESDQIERYDPTTHRVPLGLVMRYLRCETGADTFLIGIQPSRVAFGLPMSREVEESVVLLAGLLERTLAAKVVPDVARAIGHEAEAAS